MKCQPCWVDLSVCYYITWFNNKPSSVYGSSVLEMYFCSGHTPILGTTAVDVHLCKFTYTGFSWSDSLKGGREHWPRNIRIASKRARNSSSTISAPRFLAGYGSNRAVRGENHQELKSLLEVHSDTLLQKVEVGKAWEPGLGYVSSLSLVSWARLSRGERVWSNSHHHLVSNTPRISWCVNWVSDEWRHAVAFFGMLFRARGVITEDQPLQNTSQFMFTPTLSDALLLSM